MKHEISNNVVNLAPTLFEAGRIKIGRKGEKKVSQSGGEWQAPMKLDHFLIVGNSRDQTGNYTLEQKIMNMLPKEADGKIRHIPITLLFDDIELNFQSSYARYNGRNLFCRGDGKCANEAQIKDGKLVGWEGRDCVCSKADFEYQGKDKCKLTGRLQCVIRGSERLGGVFTFRTTSLHSVRSIMSALHLIKRFTGGPLAGIPLDMSVNPRQVTAPDGKQMTAYVIGIEYIGEQARLQETARGILMDQAKYGIEIKQIENEARKMLSNSPAIFGEALDEDDEHEYFPQVQEAPILTAEQPATPKVATATPEVAEQQAEIPPPPPPKADEAKPTATRSAGRKKAESALKTELPSEPKAEAQVDILVNSDEVPNLFPEATQENPPEPPTIQTESWDFD